MHLLLQDHYTAYIPTWKMNSNGDIISFLYENTILAFLSFNLLENVNMLVRYFYDAK